MSEYESVRTVVLLIAMALGAGFGITVTALYALIRRSHD